MSHSPGTMPWSGLIAFGLGYLRLSPEAFWTMTLRELDASLAAWFAPAGLGSAPDRQSLMALMQKHPDNHKKKNRHEK